MLIYENCSFPIYVYPPCFAHRYEENLTTAKDNNIRRNFFSGVGFGSLWFMIYASYALAFWYGVNLVFDEAGLDDSEKTYTAGVMTTVRLK